MANDNFWDWDNGDEHMVSSVYKDTEQNDMAQNMETRNVEPQHHATQDLEREENRIADRTEENAEVQNTEIQNCETSDNETKNDFILVGNPHNMVQNPIPQSDISYAQTEYQQNQYQQIGHQHNQYQQSGHQQNEYQQNNFQQIIPVQNIQQNQGTKDQKANFSQKDISENKVAAMAAYLLGPVGIIIALLIARDSAYTAFHVRQALKLTVSSVTLEIVAAIVALFAMVPLVGIIFKLVLVIIGIIWLVVLVLRLIAIAQVCDGEAREPAIIGKMNCFH